MVLDALLRLVLKRTYSHNVFCFGSNETIRGDSGENLIHSLIGWSANQNFLAIVMNH